jgi:hypothetical protein
MGIRFVRPESVTLTLPGGDTIIVRKRLNVGEQQAEYGRTYKTAADGSQVVDVLSIGMAEVTAYLLDWRQHDDPDASIRGIGVEDLIAVLRRLDPDSFAEIRIAIRDHILAMHAEREAEKNGQGGEPNAPAISPSPFAADGALNGSAN